MSNNIKISFILSVCLLACTMLVNAQEAAVTRYFDSNWVSVPKSEAFFYTKFVNRNGWYEATSYWVKSNSIKSKGAYIDTNFSRVIGSRVSYYENGGVSDSTLYSANGIRWGVYHYSNNGKPAYVVALDKATGQLVAQDYDETGKLAGIKYPFRDEPSFKGGTQGWIDYLTRHLKPKVVAKNGAPAGVYSVVVSFLVDSTGKVSDVKAINNPGYGSAEEAVRVIRDGPDWVPAEENKKKVNYRQMQRISFSLS